MKRQLAHSLGFVLAFATHQAFADILSINKGLARGTEQIAVLLFDRSHAIINVDLMQNNPGGLPCKQC